MNQGVGTIDPAYDQHPAPDNHEGVPMLSVNGPWLNGLYTHHRNQPYATFGKATDFTVASSSQIFLTLDESPWSINDAAFAVSAAMPQWVDWPANYHNNACGFSFCDGHAELHRWQTGTLRTGQRTPPTSVVSADNPDWLWLSGNATIKLQP
jgi:prepilin-type processing-associated H-X9-DG protein